MTCPICGGTDTVASKAKPDKGSYECRNDDCRAKFDPVAVAEQAADEATDTIA